MERRVGGGLEREEKRWRDRESQSTEYIHFLSSWLPLEKVMTGQSQRISSINRSTIPVTALFSSTVYFSLTTIVTSHKLAHKSYKTPSIPTAKNKHIFEQSQPTVTNP
jgi:hypothetical protein